MIPTPPASLYTSQSRAERLIATARLVLAAFSLAAVWLDPAGPGARAGLVYSLAAAYLAYAALLGLLAWSAWQPGRGLATHLVDLAAFAALMQLTGGSASPFFVYFVFALLAATLRWQWRGTLWTGAATLAIFVALGVYATLVRPDPDFELNRFVIRSGYLLVLAGFLAYLGDHEGRVRSELHQLAAWPRPGLRPLSEAIEASLRHAATVLRSPRLVLLIDEAEEPRAHAACWSAAGLALEPHPPGVFQPPVATELSADSFLCPDVQAARPAVLRRHQGTFVEWRGHPVARALAGRFAMRAVVSCPVRGDHFEGRLFVLDVRPLTADVVVLAEIVSHEVGASIDHHFVTGRLREVAAAEERLRLARDLHDGVLQSLTSARLKLENAASRLAEHPERTRDELLAIERALALEQRDLRAFIEELRPAAGPRPDVTFHERLAALRERIARQWGLAVTMPPPTHDLDLPAGFSQEAFFLVQEALVNVGRHAAARRARVEIAREAGGLRIVVEDDGRGFPFRGRHGHATLVREQRGPRSLCERVDALGGALLVDSRPGGARVEITLPVGAAGA